MENITLKTKIAIGYKFEVKMKNGIKIIAGKNRQIIVTIENDLYNIYAFTLKGVDQIKEFRIKGVFGGENLQNAIISSVQ